MKQSFNCKNTSCNKVSRVDGIKQKDGYYYVVCEHCESKNKLLALPKTEGAPLDFEIVGLI